MKQLLQVTVAMALAAIGLFADGITAGTPVPGGLSASAPSGDDPMYFYTFSDIFGDAGFGTLSAVPSTGDSLLVTSGTLDVTSSQDLNVAVGLYQILPEGPAISNSPSGFFQVDDLIYPNDDALAVTAYGTTGAPGGFLDLGGLVFGPTGGSGSGSETEVNIFGGNGSDSNDAFQACITCSGGSASYSINQGSGVNFTLTPIPEPRAVVILATAALLALSLRKRLPQ
jgi:hypothetical protein